MTSEREGARPGGGDTPGAAGELVDPSFWARPAVERAAVFRRLRAQGGPVRVPEGRHGAGYWALVHHADVVEASRNTGVFRSGPGVTTPPPAPWVRVVFGDSMVNMDDPEHARMRRIVSRAFTPRLLGRTEENMRRVAARIVDDVAAGGGTDFVPEVATRMPVEVICDMLDIPASDRPRIVARIDRTSEGTELRHGPLRGFRLPGSSLRALFALHRVIGRLGRRRRAAPGDDLVSALVTAEKDGRGLNSRELGAFFSLLLVAGVETTRNAIAHGLALLTEHPDQRDWVLADLRTRLPGAIEEIVRVSTPIVQFRRTLATDHELGGRRLSAGDVAVLFYGSANQDEAVFTDPDVVDLARSPNPHVGFGGGGAHFCLGAHLARTEMALLFTELFTRLPGLRSTGPPVLAASSFDNRVASLRFTYDGPARPGPCS